MERRPEVHDAVVLRDVAGRQCASRVENLGEGLVVVSQPATLPDGASFENGAALSLAWAQSDHLVTVLPTRVLASHAEGRMQVWSLVITGPAVDEQRRRVERVAVDGPVVLRSPGDETAAVTGSLVDISEKAVRCSVRTGSADGFLSARNKVVVELSLGTRSFAIPGRVEFARATKHPTELEELVVLFDEPVADVDALRKHVFALEVGAPSGAEQDDPR